MNLHRFACCTSSAALAALLTAAALPAQATSAQLSVIGTVTPSSRNAQCDDNGRVDFGPLQASELQPGAHSHMLRKIKLSILCNGNTKVALKLTDNRGGSTATVNPVPHAATSEIKLDGSVTFELRHR